MTKLLLGILGIVILLSAGLLIMSSCGGSMGAADAPPTITSVRVACTPATIPFSQTSQCSATVTGTGSFSSAVNWSASVGTISAAGLLMPPGSISSATTITVTATSVQDATKSASTTVIADPPPATASLTANPTTIILGQQSTLTWSSAYATSCTGTNFSTGGATQGQMVVTPTVTTTYSLQCTGDGGNSPAVQATVTVNLPPATASLTANPTTIILGQQSTLTWSSNYATSCTGTNFNTGGATQGQMMVTPTVTTVYSVQCTGTGGNSPVVQATVTVNLPPATASLTANPTTIAPGDQSTLTWSSNYATSCTGTNFSTGGATQGQIAVSPLVATTYSVQCDGTGGNSPVVQATVTVTARVLTAVNLQPYSPFWGGGGPITFTFTCPSCGTTDTFTVQPTLTLSPAVWNQDGTVSVPSMIDASHKHTHKYLFQACDTAGQNCSNTVPVTLNAGTSGSWGRGTDNAVYAYDGAGSTWKYDTSNNLLATYTLANGYGFGVGNDGGDNDRMVAAQAQNGGTGLLVWDGTGNLLTTVGENNHLIAGVSVLGSTVFATEPLQQSKVVAMSLAQASPVLAVATGAGSNPTITSSATGCGSPLGSGFSYSPADGSFGREDFGVDGSGNETLTSAGSLTVSSLTLSGALPQYVGGWSMAATDASSATPCSVVLIGPVKNPDGSIGRSGVVIDGRSLVVTASFPVDANAMGVVVDSPTSLTYVASVDAAGTTHASAYDLTGKLLKTLSDTTANTPAALTISADGASLGVCDSDNKCAFLSTQLSRDGDVVTYHYNVARQGFTQHETTLTLANVNANTFGLVGFFPGDGLVDAQPLSISQLQIGSGVHNVVYMVTENDSVYAYDADSGQQLWMVSAAPPGETPSDDCGCFLISPTIGITATPVIDRQRGPHGTIYLVAMTKDSSGNYHQRLHALDLTTGAEEFGGPTEIQAIYPGTGDNSQNGQVIFDPKQYAERAALLEFGGKIYLAFTSHCDSRPYTGWVMAYDALTLAQTSVLNLTPNGNSGAIWMSGAGLAADAQGYLYVLDANGTFDTTLDGNGMPINGDFGNAFLKVATSPQLAVADYFNMFDTVNESDNDEDLGSGGAMLLPDVYDNNGQVHHLAVGAGKDTNIYVVNRDNMGKFNPNNDSAIYQELDGVLPGGLWGMPAYFNNTVYYGTVGGPLAAFSITNAMLSASPSSATPNIFLYPGTAPSVSSNLDSNAIVWAVENNTPAVLHAYDATNLATELYNSNQAGSRDQFGPGNKFITPVVANGKVFVGTPNGIAEFGLLPQK